jgi:hypothetical protein
MTIWFHQRVFSLDVVSITMFLLALDVSGMVIMHLIMEVVFWMMMGFFMHDFLDHWYNVGFHNWHGMMIVLVIVMLIVIVVLWS